MKTARARVSMARAMRVAVAAPAAPSAGRPNVPGTSTRRARRFTTFAIHIRTAPMRGRPRPSSQAEQAEPMTKKGMERAKIFSGGVAPATRSSGSCRRPRMGGPRKKRARAARTPTLAP